MLGVFVLLNIALGSFVEAVLILVTVAIAFVGGILTLLTPRETWNVSSLGGLIALCGIAVQNSLVLIRQIRGLLAEGHALHDAVTEARPLAIVKIGGLVTSPVFTLFVLPTCYMRVNEWMHGKTVHAT